jgi:steroid delta-isomerase-like uncharacterized protein
MKSRDTFPENPERVSTQLLLARLMDAWNSHQVERAAELYAPDYRGIDVAKATPEAGPGGVRESMVRYLRAFPDLFFGDVETVVADQRAAIQWTARGTHQGPLMGIPPTGKSIAVRGSSFLTIADGRVARAVYLWDVAGLLRAIGLLPDLG